MKKSSDSYIFKKVGKKLIPEHHLIAEKILKRKLRPGEVVHHIDFDKRNNDPMNLMLFETQNQHQIFHNKLKRFGYLTNPMKREVIKRCLI